MVLTNDVINSSNEQPIRGSSKFQLSSQAPSGESNTTPSQNIPREQFQKEQENSKEEEIKEVIINRLEAERRDKELQEQFKRFGESAILKLGEYVEKEINNSPELAKIDFTGLIKVIQYDMISSSDE